MNTFASIVLFAQYEKVSYYSLIIDGEPLCEAHRFFNQASTWEEPEIKLRVERLHYWIEFYGKIGIKEDQLRRERKAKLSLPKTLNIHSACLQEKMFASIVIGLMKE